MVLGTIEVTRSLTTAKLDDDLAKIARVRKLAETRKFAHFDHENPENRPLFGYLVAFDSNVTENTLRKKVEAIPPEQRPHAVLVLNQAMYAWMDTAYRLEEDSLFKFLAYVRHTLEAQPLGSVDLYGYIPPMAQSLPPREP